MPTVLAALLWVARVGVTQRGLGVVDRDEAVGAADGVAEEVAALVSLARVTVTLRVLGVVDRNGAVGAADGVAEQLATPAAVGVAVVSVAIHCENNPAKIKEKMETKTVYSAQGTMRQIKQSERLAPGNC